MWQRKFYWYFFIFFIISIAENTIVFSAEIEDDSQWKLSIAVLESNGLRSIRLSPSEHFNVVLENRSKKKQKIWKDTNSWGYSILYFELTYDNGTKQIVRKQPRTWRKNTPNYWLINHGEYLVYDVFLTSRDWNYVFPKNSKVRRVKMQAVIEIPGDEQTRKFNVWSGRIKSAIYEIDILE
jgi:hypothetical protein